MKPRPACSFSRIAVLSFASVLAIALLTPAVVRATPENVSDDATQRSTATQLAQAMVERLQANPGARAAYVTPDAAAIRSSIDCTARGAQCSEAQRAAFDLANWGRALERAGRAGKNTSAGGLNEPTGCISLESAIGVYTIAVAWRGQAASTAKDALDDPSHNACGAGLGRYDDPTIAGKDSLRRVRALRVFVSNPGVP